MHNSPRVWVLKIIRFLFFFEKRRENDRLLRHFSDSETSESEKSWLLVPLQQPGIGAMDRFILAQAGIIAWIFENPLRSRNVMIDELLN